MRGCILNFISGIEFGEASGTPIIMTAQEFAFWTRRVRSIQMDISSSISTALNREDLTTETGDYDYNVSITAPAGGPSLNRNELQQAVKLLQYSNLEQDEDVAAPGSGISAEQEESVAGGSGTIIAASLTAAFGGFAFRDTTYEQPDEGWIMYLSLDLALTVPKNEVTFTGQFTTSDTPPSLPFSGSVILQATDPILGVTYSHTIQGVWLGVEYTNAPYPDAGHAGVSAASATITITPSAFYEWRDVDALYDSESGERV